MLVIISTFRHGMMPTREHLSWLRCQEPYSYILLIIQTFGKKKTSCLLIVGGANLDGVDLARSGHASMVEEIQRQLHGLIPDLIVVSVGGGGLMNGILEGLYRVGWDDIALLAMETEGAHSLNACAKAKEWTQLSEITRSAKHYIPD